MPVIEAKWDGRCKRCGASWRKGTSISYDGQTKIATCYPNCGVGTADDSGPDDYASGGDSAALELAERLGFKSQV